MLVEDEVASFVVSYKQQTNPSQLTVEQTKVFPEVVLPEVIKLNQSVCNEQKNKGIKYSFLQKKSCRKGKWIHNVSTHHADRWIVLKNN